MLWVSPTTTERELLPALFAAGLLEPRLNPSTGRNGHRQ